MKVRPACLLPFLLTVAAGAWGQSFSEYMTLRKRAGVSQAVGIPALEAFIGKRTLEVRGTIKGTFSANGRQVVMVDRGDGEYISVQATQVPDWLTNGHVTARLLIRAEREDENGELRAWLIGAGDDLEVSDYERKEAARLAKSAKPRTLQAPPPKPKGTSGRDWSLPTDQVVPIYASFIKKQNPRLRDQEAWNIANGIVGFSIMYGVDARLIMAMVMAESRFNPSATSRAGAMGLGQLMPGTARGMGLTNAYDTTQNLYATVRIVRGHLERYGKKAENGFHALVLALAAYNSGSGNVRKYNGPPPFQETQNYIRKVIAYYRALTGN